jgi:hypothetical protein
MTQFSTYDRIVNQGTLSEPKGNPDPQFALPATINWMRALAILVSDAGLSFTEATKTYKNVQKRKLKPHEENSIFEQMIFAAHQLSALEAMKSVPRSADVARMGIIAWYYGIYSAASAMLVAQDGSFQDDHTGTASCWDQQIAARGLAVSPFALRVSSLVNSKAESEIVQFPGKDFATALTTTPRTVDHAHAACRSYLRGSVSWWSWRTEDALRTSKDFRLLGVQNFRTKAARELRDARLDSRSLCFMHQAFRYRGKANYREALFLGYGNDVETKLSGYVDNLSIVLRGFISSAGAFAAKRMGPDLWKEFVSDLESKRAFSLSPSNLWS